MLVRLVAKYPAFALRFRTKTPLIICRDAMVRMEDTKLVFASL